MKQQLSKKKSYFVTEKKKPQTHIKNMCKSNGKFILISIYTIERRKKLQKQ